MQPPQPAPVSLHPRAPAALTKEKERISKDQSISRQIGGYLQTDTMQLIYSAVVSLQRHTRAEEGKHTEFRTTAIIQLGTRTLPLVENVTQLLQLLLLVIACLLTNALEIVHSLSL